MSTTTITTRFRIDGVLFDPTSVKLSDSTATYGAKRNDTDATVVADDTAMTKVSTGVYNYSFTDPADDLTYTAAIEYVYDGETYWVGQTVLGGTSETYPVSLDEMKSHLRVDSSDDDDLITSLIRAATEWCEKYTRRSFVTTNQVEYWDTFPGVFELPSPPLQSVTSIGYTDLAGDAQTVSSEDYLVDTDSIVGNVRPAYYADWPSCRGYHQDITVSYVSGYGNSGDVPDAIKAAIKMLVGHLYEHREENTDGNPITEVPFAIKALLSPYRVVGVA